MILKIIKLTLIPLMLALSGSVLANFLDEQIDAFFSEKLANVAENINVSYVSGRPQLACETPALSLANKNKFWGTLMIIAECTEKKSFIKLNVAVTGKYVVANQPIAVGKKISPNNIAIKSGRLDSLPNDVILKKEHILNYVALRNINSDQPIRSSMIRKAWAIKANEQVKVIINGPGYKVETTGRALTNAALGDKVNVRIHSTKIVEGTATSLGVIIF